MKPVYTIHITYSIGIVRIQNICATLISSINLWFVKNVVLGVLTVPGWCWWVLSHNIREKQHRPYELNITKNKMIARGMFTHPIPAGYDRIWHEVTSLYSPVLSTISTMLNAHHYSTHKSNQHHVWVLTQHLRSPRSPGAPHLPPGFSSGAPERSQARPSSGWCGGTPPRNLSWVYYLSSR